MTFEEVIMAAAKAAEKAVHDAMADYSAGHCKHEEAITRVLLGILREKFNGTIGGISWESSISTHQGKTPTEETKVGADILIHVALNTPTQSYSKGVLIQAKRLEPGERMTTNGRAELITHQSGIKATNCLYF